MHKQIWVHLALFTATFIYGANFTIAKEVMPVHIKPFGLILIRVTSAALFFGSLAAIFIRERITGKSDIIRVIVCGVVGIAMNQLFFFAGLNLTTPINAALISTLAPIVVLLFSAILLREGISSKNSIGILVACVGAVLLILSKGANPTAGQTLGNILIVLNATAYGLYLVLVKPLMQRYHPITVIAYIFIIGSVFVIPFGYPDVQAVKWAAFGPEIWWALAFMVFGLTFLTYLLNTWAMKYATPTLVGVYVYVQPTIAIIIATSLGKDIFTPQKAFFSLMILGGVYLVSRK